MTTLLGNIYFTGIFKKHDLYGDEKNILLARLKKKIDLLIFLRNMNNFDCFRFAFLRRHFHLQFFQSVQFNTRQQSMCYKSLWSVLKYCPNLKYVKAPLAITAENEEILTQFFQFMTQINNKDVNIFFNGYYPSYTDGNTVKTKKLCYLISLAARRCYSVFYVYGSTFVNPLLFKLAMTSVDFMNRENNEVKKGIFLGNYLQSSGNISLKELSNIFPEAGMMDHPSGSDAKYRRDGKFLEEEE